MAVLGISIQGLREDAGWPVRGFPFMEEEPSIMIAAKQSWPSGNMTEREFAREGGNWA